MILDTVELGASSIDDNGVLRAQSLGEELPDGTVPTGGELPIFCALGIAARPAPANENGAAEGIVAKTVGRDGVIVGAVDGRAAKAYGEIGPGETAVFATGENYDARALFKNRQVSLLIGDNMLIDFDNRPGKEKISILAFKQLFRMDPKNGICLQAGGAGMQINKGCVVFDGTVMIGRGATMQVLAGPPNPAGFPMAPSGMIPMGKGLFVSAIALLSIGVGLGLGLLGGV